MNQKTLDLSTTANARQVGGSHYKKHLLEHWDTVVLFELDYFQGNIWKYVLRWRDKAGIQDLNKAGHCLQKYIEVETARANGTLTRSILERAILALEEIESKERAGTYGTASQNRDDPVGDVLSGYPRDVANGVRREGFMENFPSEVPLTHDEHGPLYKKDLCDEALRDGMLKRKDKCTHGADDCPIHPNGGCPKEKAA